MQKCRSDHDLDSAWKKARKWFDRFAVNSDWVILLTIPGVTRKRLLRGMRVLERGATDYTTGSFWVSSEVMDPSCTGLEPSLGELFRGNVAIVSIHYATRIGATPLLATACVRPEEGGVDYRVEIFITYEGIAESGTPMRQRFDALWHHARTLADAFVRDHVLVRVMEGPATEPRTVARF